MSTIDIEDRTDVNPTETPRVIVRTYPANGSRYGYTFEGDGDERPLELVEKTHTTNPATTDERKRIVAPNVTPAVREELAGRGYELA